MNSFPSFQSIETNNLEKEKSHLPFIQSIHLPAFTFIQSGARQKEYLQANDGKILAAALFPSWEIKKSCLTPNNIYLLTIAGLVFQILINTNTVIILKTNMY